MIIFSLTYVYVLTTSQRLPPRKQRVLRKLRVLRRPRVLRRARARVPRRPQLVVLPQVVLLVPLLVPQVPPTRPPLTLPVLVQQLQHPPTLLPPQALPRPTLLLLRVLLELPQLTQQLLAQQPSLPVVLPQDQQDLLQLSGKYPQYYISDRPCLIIRFVDPGSLSAVASTWIRYFHSWTMPVAGRTLARLPPFHFRDDVAVDFFCK